MVRARLHDPSANMSFGQWYSATWDILAGRGSDEEYNVVVLASFEKREDATAYARTCAEYVIGVRPPSLAYEAALAWLTLLTEARGSEGVPLTQGRATT